MDDLIGTEWKMIVSLPTDEWLEPEKHRAPTIKFGRKKVQGDGGVNQYDGSFSVDGNSLKIDMLGSTKASGGRYANHVERWFLANLDKAQCYEIVADILMIDLEGDTTFVFTRINADK